jgi:hypothetical protein
MDTLFNEAPNSYIFLLTQANGLSSLDEIYAQLGDLDKAQRLVVSAEQRLEAMSLVNLGLSENDQSKLKDVIFSRNKKVKDLVWTAKSRE